MDITIKNGIKLAVFDNYIIYQMYTDDAEEYYMCTPTKSEDKYQMIIDFPEEYYNSLLPNDKINKISKICDFLYQEKNNYIYVLTNVTTYELSEARTANDNHAYSVLLRRLQKYTYNTYHALTNGENESLFNLVIDIIIQTDADKKFIDWLDVNLSGLFNDIRLDNSIHVETIQDDNDNKFNDTITNNYDNVKDNKKVKTLVLLNNKRGFSSIFFTIIILIVSLIIGIIFSLFVLNQ